MLHQCVFFGHVELKHVVQSVTDIFLLVDMIFFFFLKNGSESF